MTETKTEEIEVPKGTPAAEVKGKGAAKNIKKIIIKDVSGEEADPKDYFFNGVIPSGFIGTCGNPVDREELIGTFNKVFKSKIKYLFYRARDKEVYLVIVPLKYSTSVGIDQESSDGDFQKHAISFLSEGSVNLDTLKQKLERILKFVKKDEE